MKTPALSRTKKVGLVAVALVALAGGGAVCGLRGADSGSKVTQTERGTSAEPSAESLATTKTGRFDRARAPGLRHVYSARFAQDLVISGDGRGSNANIKIRVNGDLSLAFVAHVDKGHRIFAELSNATLEFGQRSPRTAAVERELARPFYVLAETDGRVRGYVFERGLSPIAQNILRGLVGSAQFAVRDEASFTANEDDIQGSYVAAYAPGDGGEIVKTKRPYDKLASMTSLARPDEHAAIESRGRAVAVVGDDGWVTKLDAEAHTKASMGANMPVATTDARLEMTLSGTAPALKLLGRFENESANLVEAGPFGTGDDSEASRVADARLVGDETMDSLLVAARGLASDDDQGVLAVTDKMAAKLRLTPDDADRMAALAKTLPSREGEVLVSGLGGAGTKEATRALGKILGEKNAPAALRAQAATALTFSGEHAAEARESLIEGLSDKSRDVRESSALALGNVARDLDGDLDSVSELVRKYREAASDDERALLLQALGNSGSPELLPIAVEALASPNESLREAAAQSLRFLPIGDADTVLGRTLASDDAEPVRLAAIDSMGYRIVEMHAAALGAAIASDVAGRVRGAVVEVVSRALASRGKTLSPAARSALQGLLTKAAEAEKSTAAR